jgi:hypothetical protein
MGGKPKDNDWAWEFNSETGDICISIPQRPMDFAELIGAQLAAAALTSTIHKLFAAKMTALELAEGLAGPPKDRLH